MSLESTFDPPYLKLAGFHTDPPHGRGTEGRRDLTGPPLCMARAGLNGIHYLIVGPSEAATARFGSLAIVES